MKTIYTFLSGLLLLNASCITVYHTPGKYEDDVYYSSKNRKVEAPSASSGVQTTTSVPSQEGVTRPESKEAPVAAPTTTEQYMDDKGNTYITNNYNDHFNSDDYYDYEYAARLRRFHNPYSGYGYYDGYYTNSYWYSYNPFQWGVSIYM